MQSVQFSWVAALQEACRRLPQLAEMTDMKRLLAQQVGSLLR